MSELSEKFKEGQYEDRYLKAVGKAARLQTILDGWVNYAQELSQVRQLQVEHDSTAASVEEGLGQLLILGKHSIASWARPRIQLQRLSAGSTA